MPELTGDEARRRFAAARVARLATADASGRPHLVPVVFARYGTDGIVTAVTQGGVQPFVVGRRSAHEPDDSSERCRPTAGLDAVGDGAVGDTECTKVGSPDVAVGGRVADRRPVHV